jgi:hypothetical protein
MPFHTWKIRRCGRTAREPMKNGTALRVNRRKSGKKNASRDRLKASRPNPRQAILGSER